MTRPEDIFHELGDPTRLSVFRSILDRRLNVSQIVAELGLTQPQVSYHLKRLREAGLAVEQKDGRWVWYRANRESEDVAVRALLDLMSDWMEAQGEAGAESPGPAGEPAGPVRPPELGEIPAAGRPRGRAERPAARQPREREGRPVVQRPEKKDDLEDFLL